MGAKNNDDSVMEWIEEEAIRLKKMAEEAIQRKLQREQLENMIKNRLEDEIEKLQDDIKAHYKLSNSMEEVLYIKDILSRDFNGKAKQALNSRLETNWAMLNGTQMTWSQFINSFGTASGFVRFFR